MATSGSFETSSVEGRSLVFSWNRTGTNIANNTSTIAWSVKGGGSYTYGYVTCGDIDVVINGSTVYNSGQNDRVNVWSGGVVASGTAVITHNADGSKSFSARVAGAIYNYAQNVSKSSTWTLDSIPRGATIDKVANSSGTGINTINTGNDIRVYYTPRSTSFKYRVSVSMNGSSAQNNAAGVSVGSTSQQYYQVNIPHSWLSNKESGTLTCRVETLSGSTVIGNVTKTITMTVPSSIVPTLGNPSASPINSNATINSWGVYVTNNSKVRLTCSASGNSGSSIVSFQISGAASSSVASSSLSTDINLTSGGLKTFGIRAVDTRGRYTSTKYVTINVSDYFTPSIQSFNVTRSDSNGNTNSDGTSVNLSFVGYYANIGANTLTASFSYKLASATTFINLPNTASSSGTGTLSQNIVVNSVPFALANEYDFSMRVTDSLGYSSSTIVRINSVLRTLNVAKYGNGVAVGKMSTVTSGNADGKFECGWDADFDGDVTVDGALNTSGNIYVGGNSSIYFNNTKMEDFVVAQGTSGEWSYRKWNSGTAECWRTISGNITKYSTWNGMPAYQGSAQWPSNFFVANPIAQYQVYIGTGFAMPARGGVSTTTNFIWYALASADIANVAYKVDVYAIGRWK